MPLLSLRAFVACKKGETYLVCRITYIIPIGPCHHGMARPQVADGGTASNMEGSFEYVE
jgi:hypothetical protein